MSSNGQGDQNTGETNKDDEPEISSTTSKSIGLLVIGYSNENSAAAAAIDPEDTGTSKEVKSVAPNLPSSSYDKKLVIDAVIASTTVKIQENSDKVQEDSQLRVDTGSELGITEVSLSKALEDGSSDVTKEAGIGSPKPNILKDIPELIQEGSDKESSIEDDIELKWDEDDDATEPTQTDYMSDILDKALGEDTLENPGFFKISSDEKTFKSVIDTKCNENVQKDLIKGMTANESNEESQNIIPEVDRLTQDEVIDKTTERSTECENPIPVEDTPNHPKDNKTPKNALADDEVMDVDDRGELENEVIKVAVSTNDSFEESKSIIAEIDRLTQDDELIKTCILPAEIDHHITLPECDKQLENVELPIIDEIVSQKQGVENPETVSKEISLTKGDEMDIDDSADIIQEKKIPEENEKKKREDKQLVDVDIFNNELIESENTEDLVSKTVSKEIPFNPLTKDDEKIYVYNSGENKNDKEVLIAATSASGLFENCQKTTEEENDSLSPDDKIGKTAELPSEIVLRHNLVTVNELDKKLVDVEILENKLDESDKADMVNSESETKAIEVPSNLFTKDDGMDVDNSNGICNDTTTVDDFTVDVTEAQDNSLDSVQKEIVVATKDNEVLDNIEDKQDTNIRHDNIEQVLKSAETIASENFIASTDKTILKEDQLIPVKDGPNKSQTTEDIPETSQPVNDKNKDAGTNQALDDKLTPVQRSESNNGQEIDDTASSMQDSKKFSDDIALKSSESQAVDDKVTGMQEVDDKTLEAENILLNTETVDKLEENVSITDNSIIDTTISPNKHHRINKPNVMLDIPTQDFSDIEAELSDSENNDDFEKTFENTENIEKSTKIVPKPSESNKSAIVIPEITTPTIEIDENNDDFEKTLENTENNEKSTRIVPKPSESNKIVIVIPEITTPTIEIDATTSKLNITTVSPLKLNLASTDVKIYDKFAKRQDISMKNDENVKKSSQQVEKLDDKPSSSVQVDDQQPSCSKDIGDGKLTSDDADDVQETDSLGLLAESSRVMDDDIDDEDEEPEELEADENDDDEDFDPYDESSSQMLEDLGDTDESNPPTDGKKEVSEIIDADGQTDGQKDEKPEKITNILEKVLGNFADLRPPAVASSKVLTCVEVEGSSDSDDVEEISNPEAKDLVSVKVPAEVDVMLTSGAEGGTSAMRSNKDEVVISVPKATSHKVPKINTSEVTIKSATKNLESLQIPETTSASEKKPKDEVFNIDSDEEEEKKVEEVPQPDEKENSSEPPTPPKSRKCINPHCKTTSGVLTKASRGTIAYYSLARRSGAACRECAERATERSQALVNGIKDLRPLLSLEMETPAHQLVEISDSDEEEGPVDDSERIGERGAEFLLENLVDGFDKVWQKYEMDRRLKQTEAYLMAELEQIEAGAKELDAMLNECQMKTDAIRTDFYKDYEPKRKHLGGIVIHDTPFSSYSHTEKDVEATTEPTSNRYPKRRPTSTLSDPPAKKQAVDSPDKEKLGPIDNSKMEEDKDISVVKLSAESAPASLPPHGELVKPPLHTGMSIYAMRNAFGTWNKAKILEILQEPSPSQPFTQCRVKFEHKVKNSCKVLAARCLAYSEPCEVRYTIGTRVIALFKDPQSARLDAYYAGVVAEVPNPVNNYRYLVFFDDGYAQYIQHADTRLVCEASALVWEEVHPFIHDFVRNYLKCYPERPMVRLRQGETLNTEWNGKWWSSRVLQVDASIALIHFEQDNRTEWIYRGSTRLEPLFLELRAAKAGGRSRLRLPRTKQIRSNMPCVEYTRSDEQASAKAAAETQAQHRQAEELRRQRAVAKKSTTDRHLNQPTVAQGASVEGTLSRVVYYTPKHAVKPSRFSPHACNPACGKRPDLLALKDLRTYNPLAKPLLSGWERQTVRYKGHREVMYRAPCGRRLRNMPELHRYLSLLQSDLSVDLFDFTPGTHCLAEFMLNKCIVGKKDLSHGKENVPVPCVNYYDESLPEFCSYNTERTPTAGVPLNLDPDFLCGCDCTDDCQDKSKCACWKMTLEGARTIGLEGDNIGYVYRRLPEPLPSGIYECNSRCKCKQTCLNRVAQHPLQLKLQVFKTTDRGWGIRALNDVPKGSFLCVYAGNLLTDATANLDGLNEGDEYLAELDYIEVVEGMKEGYEDDIPEKDKALDKKGATRASESESESSSESEEEKETSGKDDDFQPSAYIPQPQGSVYFQKSLRKREKAKKKEEQKEKQKEQEAKKKDDCITISDDEEVREPSRFTADDVAADRKHSSRVSVRTLFGKDEACYIMDAKVQGNIGRYLNHSCHPNVFVQNVFVDTHDPRFPWVAFFALSHVKAGNELTWNYNYDVGSVPGKVLYCYCGAPNCRGRLL